MGTRAMPLDRLSLVESEARDSAGFFLILRSRYSGIQNIANPWLGESKSGLFVDRAIEVIDIPHTS